MSWAPNPAAARIRASLSKKGKTGADEDQDDKQDSENGNDHNAIDMRREDAELEKILRDYNNEARPGSRKLEEGLDKPLDLPFYKRIQLPTHLKWVSIYSVSAISIIGGGSNYAFTIETK